MNSETTARLAELLRAARTAHHAAFADTDGADPDWPIWYAENLRDLLAAEFGIDLTRSHLIYCLIRAEMDHTARAPEQDWAAFYAAELLSHLSPQHTSSDRLALYYMPSCPFCIRVLRTIEELGEVEYRDTIENPQHRADLIAARGRATVPVLRIASADGEDRWMPESRDIIQYLKTNFG